MNIFSFLMTRWFSYFLFQAEVVAEFMRAITEKTLTSTITLTAARGRGKSAAMGLSLGK